MGTMLIAYRNYVDGGTLSGGSWQASLPVTNLADRQPRKVARSINAAEASTVAILDIGAGQPIRFVGLIRHNLTQAGRWRLTMAADPAFTIDVVDSGWTDAWPSIFPFGTGAWGEYIWGGKIDAEEASAYGLSSYQIFGDSPRRRYLRIEISDEANPSGYIEIGRLIVAPAWQPSLNMQLGWSIEQVDQSRIVKSRGGQTFVDTVPKFRRLRFKLSHLEADEMFAAAYELERLKGKGGEILVMADPDNLTHLHRQTIYGVLGETTPVMNQEYGRFEKDFVVEELI